MCVYYSFELGSIWLIYLKLIFMMQLFRIDIYAIKILRLNFTLF